MKKKRSYGHLIIGSIAILAGIPIAALQADRLTASITSIFRTDFFRAQTVQDQAYQEDQARVQCARDGESVYWKEEFGPAVCCEDDGAKMIPMQYEYGGSCLPSHDEIMGKCSIEWRRTCGDGVCSKEKAEDMCSCSQDCPKTVKTICGNGIWEYQNEQCDDGNLVSGDGCSADCRIEGETQCKAGPSRCRRPAERGE